MIFWKNCLTQNSTNRMIKLLIKDKALTSIEVFTISGFKEIVPRLNRLISVTLKTVKRMDITKDTPKIKSRILIKPKANGK